MFKVSTSPEKGRILLATQDIEPNTMIIQDEAILGYAFICQYYMWIN
jgi:hypothetical protein